MTTAQRDRAILLHTAKRPIYQIAMIVGVDADELHEHFRNRLVDSIQRGLQRGESVDEIAECFDLDPAYVRRFVA